MPRKSAIKCYFGCMTEGPLHSFPKPTESKMHQFIQWKNVLDEKLKTKSNTYIFNNIKLCNLHFEAFYRSTCSKRLTRNAVPTINLSSTSRNMVPQSHPHPIPMDVDTHQASSNQQIFLFDNISKDKQQKYTKDLTRASGEIRNLKVKLLKMKGKCKTLRQQVRQARKLSLSKRFLTIVENLPEPTKVFTNMQLSKTSQLPRGRRFSMKEKLLCLYIYKQSQKGYNFLQRLFTLPSKRTMQKMLSGISLAPGLNKNLFDHLRKAVKELPDEKKLCSLIFDEVALSPGLFYEQSTDDIRSFEDSGINRTITFADYALVFMIKSLKGKFKQPVCFTFCQSATKMIDLKNILKSVIIQLQSTGLKVVCTVCDQSPINRRLIKTLMNETREKYLKSGIEYKYSAFEVNNVNIFPLYDPPHVLIGIRNDFLQNNLEFTLNGEVKIAEWKHLQMLFDIDVGEDDVRLLNKLTECHINKDKIPKMKVKHAAQVFSQRVAAAMRLCANHNILPKECTATSDIIFLFDKLFDSFNAHCYKSSDKVYKCALSGSSPHFKLWEDALPVLRSIKFHEIDMYGNKKLTNVPPSVLSWIHNINVMKELFTYLKSNENVTSLLTRNLNQDPLENFLSRIRSNGIRNVFPTCSQFISAYKTLLVNNLTSPRSVGANCEPDGNTYLLKSLKYLFKNKSSDNIAENINVYSLIFNN